MALLTDLPDDIFAQITELLNYLEFIRLCILGNKRLLFLLQNGGIRTIELPSQIKIYRAKLVSSMRGLKVLKSRDTKWPGFDESVMWKSITPHLSSSLLELHLKMNDAESESAFWKAAVPIPSLLRISLRCVRLMPPFKALFPNLEQVQFTSELHYLGWSTLSLPASVQILDFEPWGDDGIFLHQLHLLPRNLVHLTMALTIDPDDASKTLPEILASQEPSDEPQLSHLLPPSLGYLDLRFTFESLSNIISYLPRGLETLIISDSICRGDEDIKILPAGLTHLHLFSVRISSTSLLPKSLLHLRIDSSHESLGEDGWKTMPPDLTSLHLGCDKLSPGEIAPLPRSLKTLILPRLTNLSDEALAIIIPPHLTILSISCNKSFTGKGMDSLPRSLLTLNLNSADLPNDAIPHLPPKLRTLRISASKRLTDDCLPHFPRSLTLLDLYGNNIISWRNLGSLPAEHCRVFLSARELYGGTRTK
jgi:hypothetical protein